MRKSATPVIGDKPRHELMSRRMLLGGTVAAAAAGVLGAVSRVGAGHGWPERTVRIVVPYPAGGSIDILARIIADQLKHRFGQSFVVENKPGAGGNIGIASVIASPADGYTIGAATVGHFAINPFLYRQLPYDPERDFAPVSLIYEMPNVFMVPSHVPATTVAEFTAWAKSRERVSYGSPGMGTSPHLCAALFCTRTGLNATHVPFRGAAQTIPAMLAGDVDFSIDNLTSYMSFIENGTMRALAVTADQRWETLPDLPTMREAGLPDFVVTSWAGFVVPAGTPRPIIDLLAEAIQEITTDPAIRDRFRLSGAMSEASTPEGLAAKAARERPVWQEMVRVSGIDQI